MFINFCKNYLSTLLFIVLGYYLYTHIDFYTNFITTSYSYKDFSVYVPYIFYGIIVLYTVLLVPFYILYPEASKARLSLSYFKKTLQGNKTVSEKEKIAFLAWCVKLFFVPLMVTWFTGHIFSLLNNWTNLFQNISLVSSDFSMFFSSQFFWTAFSTILFFDVLFFTLGYLIEAPFLKNTIRSVEPTLIGWAACVLCYPPLNSFVTNMIGWYSNDFPQFQSDVLQISIGISIIILMSIYAWASVSLGLKASNLTNRGIVSRGPYAYIRHPAYITKTVSWFLGSIPMFYISFTVPEISFWSVLLGVGGWTFIYYLRAMTEENHLSLDPEYRTYKKQVPYKFIPKVW